MVSSAIFIPVAMMINRRKRTTQPPISWSLSQQKELGMIACQSVVAPVGTAMTVARYMVAFIVLVSG